MKRHLLTLTFLVAFLTATAGIIEKTFTFNQFAIDQKGDYATLLLENTRLAGIPGNPALPWHAVSLILPPGESASAIEIIGSDEVLIAGNYLIYPMQEPQPLSTGDPSKFIWNEAVYRSNADYPGTRAGTLRTQFLNGYSFAICSFTPATYNPASGTLRYYSSVTVRITTSKDLSASQALSNLPSSENLRKRVALAAQNPEMVALYPDRGNLKSGYQILIVTPAQYQASYDDLISYYASKSMVAQVATTESIQSSMTGQDLQEKIRNFIIQEYQGSSIEHVLLGGDAELVPYRGFYCYVISGSGYEESNIPADLYYSALDGNWNTNGDYKWGEPGEDDLLPEISVARFPFSTPGELANIIHKTISYQQSPVAGELNKPYMVAEHLYSDPMTFGQDYLELLIDDHGDNGYFTHGIPSSDNTIYRLYDTLISYPSNIYSWDVPTLLAQINQGKSFIHHCGHSNEYYMMRLFTWDITNANFAQVNGIDHNYTLMYTHGCLCGAFDWDDCIAETAVKIENFLAGGVFNSRYGWFDQGLTEGPSAHLHREFISALYHDTLEYQIREIGAAHTMSKIKTAPFVDISGEFEPGAQRWCHYTCNVLGDPAMAIWTDDPATGLLTNGSRATMQIYPNPAKGSVTIILPEYTGNDLRASICNSLGQQVRAFPIKASALTGKEITVSLDGIAPGTYYLTLNTGSSLFGTTLLVTR